MSLLGKLCLALSGVSLIIVMSTSWILGGWLPVLYIFLALFLLGIILALVVDYKLYVGFLLMRTTKNGMSMGVSILITLVFCAALAYLSERFKHSVDITEEKINSLSPQTEQLLDGLEADMYLTVFYKGSTGAQKKDLIKQSLKIFKQSSSKIKDRYYDAYLNNKLAQEYLNELSNKEGGDIFVFTEYKGKKVLVEVPFNEEKLTTAMIKVTRREKKTIYFLSGHGERDSSDSEGGEGAGAFKNALARSSFVVKDWSFAVDGKLPEDASALIIVGPQRPYMDKEMQWLEEYLKGGGKLLVALDPDKKHNLAALLKKFGVIYKSHYIMDRVGAVVGLGPFSPMGVYFDAQSSVTKSFRRGTISVFHIASDLEIDENSNFYSVTELVKTNVNALSLPEMTQKSVSNAKRTSHVMGLLVEKKNKKAEPSKEKDSKTPDKQTSSMILAVYGDSDFLSNNFIDKGINRDLVLNTISYMADEMDLVSIRPKKLKSTQLTLKSSDQMGIVLFAVLLPIICFICSFVIWFRRREA